jgi:hypothetical protein
MDDLSYEYCLKVRYSPVQPIINQVGIHRALDLLWSNNCYKLLVQWSVVSIPGPNLITDQFWQALLRIDKNNYPHPTA